MEKDKEGKDKEKEKGGEKEGGVGRVVIGGGSGCRRGTGGTVGEGGKGEADGRRRRGEGGGGKAEEEVDDDSCGSHGSWCL